MLRLFAKIFSCSNFLSHQFMGEFEKEGSEVFKLKTDFMIQYFLGQIGISLFRVCIEFDFKFILR